MIVNRPKLTNAVLLNEIIKCKKDGKVSDRLGNMILHMATRLLRLKSWSYTDDVKNEMLKHVIEWQLSPRKDGTINVLRFDTSRSSNPYAYIASSIHGNLLYVLNMRKKEKILKELLND